MPRIVQIIEGLPAATVRLAGTDTSQLLSAAYYFQNGRFAKTLLLTVESAQLRIAFGGAVPTQGTSGLGHILYVGDILELESLEAIKTLRYINALNGQTAAFQLTLSF